MKQYTPGEKCLVMTRDQVRGFDAWAINELKIPGAVLMENAGRSCAELIVRQLAGTRDAKVCIFCGTGNNGGDGYVIARHLLNRGVGVTVVIAGDRDKIKGDARINLDVLERMAAEINQLDLGGAAIASRVRDHAQSAGIIVDALFGTGLRGELSREYKELIESMNTLDLPVLAVDIPSGLDCDSGKPLGAAIKATWTVTFVAVKAGFASDSGATEYTGQIYVASIGVEPGEYIRD